MIYDKSLTIYELDVNSAAMLRKLKNPVPYYYAERDVYGSRYFMFKQGGEKISMMCEMPRVEGESRITADNYCIPDDGKVYKIVQAQYETDKDGLLITVLSLERFEGKYEILRS